MVSIKRIKLNAIFYEYKKEDMVIKFDSAYSLYLADKMENQLNIDEYHIRGNQEAHGNMKKISKEDNSNVLTK